MRSKSFKQVVTVVIALAAALFVVACGDNSDSDSNANVNSQGLDVNGCKPAKRPPAKTVSLKKPKKALDPAKDYFVDFKTNCGDFTVKLDVENNPKTAASFAQLATAGVYDDTWFHRIVADFVIQGGDPAGTGTGDAGYKVVERPRGKYKIGTVAMAKAGNEPPGSSGSQFYVVTGQQGVSLPPEYAIAGRVTDGDETVQIIAGYAGGATGEAGKPSGAAVVKKAVLRTR
ncbi:MAG: peptidylprolyl isomerase [Solirubrobacterales bacterium]